MRDSGRKEGKELEGSGKNMLNSWRKGGKMRKGVGRSRKQKETKRKSKKRA